MLCTEALLVECRILLAEGEERFSFLPLEGSGITLHRSVFDSQTSDMARYRFHTQAVFGKLIGWPLSTARRFTDQYQTSGPDESHTAFDGVMRGAKGPRHDHIGPAAMLIEMAQLLRPADNDLNSVLES